MKAKIKKGDNLLFSKGCSNNWDNLNISMIINFNDRYTYNSFKQLKNHLLIDTDNGEVDIVFTSEIPKLEFESYCKDQLVLKIIK